MWFWCHAQLLLHNGSQLKALLPILVNMNEDHFHKLQPPLPARTPCFLYGHYEVTVLLAKVNTSTCALNLISFCLVKYFDTIISPLSCNINSFIKTGKCWGQADLVESEIKSSLLGSCVTCIPKPVSKWLYQVGRVCYTREVLGTGRWFWKLKVHNGIKSSKMWLGRYRKPEGCWLSLGDRAEKLRKQSVLEWPIGQEEV